MTYLKHFKHNLTSATLFFLILAIQLTGYSQSNPLNQLVNEYHESSHLTPQDFRVATSHTSKRSGITHYYIMQTHGGIDIYNAQSSIHTDSQGKVIHSTDRSIKTVNSVKKSLSIGPEQALVNVAEHFELSVGKVTKVLSAEPSANRFHRLDNKTISELPISANVIYFPKNGTLSLGWQITFEKADDYWWWDVIVDASTGEILNKATYTTSCNFDHEHSCTSEGHSHTVSKKVSDQEDTHQSKNYVSAIASASYNVFAMPLESPADGNRSIVSDPWLNAPNASPQGWHDFNGSDFMTTFGNNVRAATDIDANNGPDQPLPNGGASFAFNFPLDLTLDPMAYTDASITNLFYWNNIVHDVMYEYGFDEPSGNFQFSNYGNTSALEGDFVNADALDGSGTNNANFSTPADGNGLTSRPRMQMFRWNSPGSTTFDVNSPSSIAGSYVAVQASFGPQDISVTGNLVIVDDGTSNPTSEGCDPLINGAAVSGNIALIDRGNCDFDLKVGNAEAEGAIAAVVCNNIGGPPTGMPGDDDPVVTIPAIMISQTDCNAIRASLPGINITMTLSSTGTDLDSDLDNVIIAHEYGHGVSIRLTGGFGNSGCLNTGEQMGEGWSDYLGLWLTMKTSDFADEPRAVGTYVLGQGDGDDGGRGIRPFLYTRDMSINFSSYKYVGNQAPAGTPLPFGPPAISIPHGVGTIWCSMLWDLTWDLVDVYGFDTDFYAGTGGNNIAMALVIEGLKLQGCSPGFVDGRDGILAADMALYGGANQCLIWNAFARRGLGLSADQMDPDITDDGIEGFDVPASCSTPGCTDPAAENYDVAATTDDSSCTYCSDGIMNGDETGVDCGGSGPGCPTCPTCFDGMINGSETGVDCGGMCPPCTNCSDGIMNGDETGVDCGGSCPACDCTDVTLTYPTPNNITTTTKWVDQWIMINGGATNVLVPAGNTVHLHAGQYIEVQPMFEVKQGAELLLNIEGCN